MRLITTGLMIAMSCGTVCAATPAPQLGSGETDGYTLVWQDLFDADVLNPSRWNIEVNGNGSGNNELQYYTDHDTNVRLGDDGNGNGCLILTARREQFGGRSFTSGRINSKNRIVFTHGKLEASIRLPKTANGLWPAFWMMGNDYETVGWPRCGETDILEMGNADGIKLGNQETYFNGASHWGPQWPNASHVNALVKAYSLQDGEFHLYTVIWDENSIKMYVDLDRFPKQNPYYRLDCPCDDPDNAWSPGNYFHKDNFILFNLAIGGDFTGIHDPENITALNDDNNNEASMYVNYVRIYQRGLASDNLDVADPGDTSSVDEVIADSRIADSIRYDGGHILSENSELALYSISSARIATSCTGDIATYGLAPGLYLACNNTNTCKVLVRN